MLPLLRRGPKLMKTDTRLLKCGKTLLAGLALLLVDCRNSNPPAKDICIGDGFGGSDCVLKAGSTMAPLCMPHTVDGPNAYYCPPSALKNFWMTPEADMAAFAAWCYDTSISNVKPSMQSIKRRALQ